MGPAARYRVRPGGKGARFLLDGTLSNTGTVNVGAGLPGSNGGANGTDATLVDQGTLVDSRLLTIARAPVGSSGRLTITASSVLDVAQGGTVVNAGVLTNAGRLTLYGGYAGYGGYTHGPVAQLTTSGTLANSGTLTIGAGDNLYIPLCAVESGSHAHGERHPGQ